MADWRVLVGFLGQTAIAARCSAMVLAEAEARRLRALYPDSRAVVWVARSAASSTTRWSALERKLKDEAEAGNATEVYGISGRVQADRRVQESVRRAIRLALADTGEISSLGTLSYSIEELMSHIAAQFSDGMSWDNWGEWHIDHIKPRSAFDMRDPVQLAKCWALSNLQPLWAKENQSKGHRERRAA